MTDAVLRKKLSDIENHIPAFNQAKELFLELEAHKKVLWSRLFTQAEGKTVADREAAVYASVDWENFAKGHAKAEAAFHKEQLVHELLLKKYDAAHLTLKTDTPAIRRQLA